MVMARAAHAEGVDAELVLRAAGLEPEVAPTADEHVVVERYLDAWRFVLDRLRGDPAFPLRVAEVSELEDTEVFGFLAMTCQTLGEAFERTAAYRALYHVGARWEMHVDGQASRLVWSPWAAQLEDAAYDAAMDFHVADMAKSVRRLGRLGPRPTAVRLMRAPPRDAGPFLSFFGVMPTFGARSWELVYPAGLENEAVTSASSRLRDYFDLQCRELVSKLAANSSIVAQVRKRLILAMDGGDTSIEAVGKALGMSPRTLQRRIADEGTRYAQVLDDVRCELAKRYLTRATVSASEVAYLVGFTEPPAFFKAFKRWTGVTPRAFQQGDAAL